MAWYYGVFSCGHEGRVDVIGPMKNRQWIVDRKFENMCKECYAKKIKDERERLTKESIKKAEEMELIKLEGTEKQIAWAETLRQKMIQEFESYSEEIDVKFLVLNYILETENKAFFYIDNRSVSVESFINRYKNKVDPNIIDEKILEKDLIYEAAISPNEIKYDGIVEIRATQDKIDVFYIKNKDFINIVKSLNYRWNGCWSREIKETTGTYIDRAAELGSKLLNSGFIVSIQNEEIRERAVKGDYEQECYRWINVKDKSKLAIKWLKKNDKLYDASKRLPTSKWNGGAMIVDVSKYKEVKEFAEMFGFKFTKAAMKMIDEYILKINNIKKINPSIAELIPDKNGLDDILNSSREVLEDLRDDD